MRKRASDCLRADGIACSGQNMAVGHFHLVRVLSDRIEDVDRQHVDLGTEVFRSVSWATMAVWTSQEPAANGGCGF
jgi:hypothetical protein